jgi:cytochrome c-type biogenesis protein CcmH
VLCLLALLVIAQPVAAQDAGGATPVTANEVKDVADELWCPLCSGVRLDACELKACEQMREVIADKLASGEPKDAIKNYFVAQYGPQVMGEPPMEGFNWLAWLLPVAVLIGGGVFVWQRTRKMIGAPAQESAPSPGDEYQAQLDEELKHYD